MRGKIGSGRRGATWRTLACMLTALAMLSACGGGADETAPAVSSAPPGDTAPAAPVENVPVVLPLGGLKADCVGLDCAATGPGTYAGSGVGIWKVVNDTAAPVAVPLSIQGLSGQDVTLVFTNITMSPQPMHPLPLASRRAGQTPYRSLMEAGTAPTIRPVPAAIREFNRVDGPALLKTQRLAPPRRAMRAAPAAVGDRRTWHVHVETMETRETTLQRSATRDGVTVNLWVEDGEAAPDRMSDAMLDGILARFFTDPDAVYGRATALVGQPWGTHEYSDLIAPGGPLDIVLVNFDHDDQPYGLMGYFWSYNNFRVSPDTPESNQSLSLYLDTETFYRAMSGVGVTTQYNTLSHEFMHMVNFYQRGVLLDNTFDTWMEEMSALMLEDVLADGLTPTYNPIRDGRFPDYLNQGGYNCNLIAWDDDALSACFGYSVAGSFGAFLLRQYGLDFYRNLLRSNTSTDSIALLDAAIRNAGGPGMAEAVRRAALNAALLPAVGTPAGFGLPQRIEHGVTLVAVNGPEYLADRMLPATVPAQLAPLGSFPAVRRAVSGTYAETVTVPAGTTLSVVVR